MVDAVETDPAGARSDVYAFAPDQLTRLGTRRDHRQN